MAKLAGVAMLVAEFAKLGFGQWFRYFTGLTEITGAVLILIPRTGFFGALILLCVCIGALFAQIAMQGDLVHVFVLGALAAAAAWLTRPILR